MGLFVSQDITGIDVGTASIKAVRIAGGRRPTLLSASMVELPLEPGYIQNTAADLGHLLSGKNVRGKNVITLIPGKHLTIRALTMPKMPRSELREAVRWESKRHISYPLEAAQVEYLIVGEKREGAADKYDILMIAVERGTVIEHLAPFSGAGIKVTAVDAHPLALRNALRLHAPEDGMNTLVVDMGAGKTEINIFNGSVLRLSRCLDLGGFTMTRAAAEKTGGSLHDAEAAKKAVDVISPSDGGGVSAAVKGVLDSIIQEIRRSVEYYKTVFREQEIARTVLTGGVSLMTGIGDYFSLALEGPVEVDDPFAELAHKKHVLDELGPIAPRFSAAVGLALRKL